VPTEKFVDWIPLAFHVSNVGIVDNHNTEDAKPVSGHIFIGQTVVGNCGFQCLQNVKFICYVTIIARAGIKVETLSPKHLEFRKVRNSRDIE